MIAREIIIESQEYQREEKERTADIKNNQRISMISEEAPA